MVIFCTISVQGITIQGKRETLVQPMKVEINLDIPPKEVDVSEVKTEKASEVKIGERESSQKTKEKITDQEN